MIDLELLNSVSQGDKTFLKTMFDIFLKQTPECIEDLNKGLEGKDFSVIKAAAHKMKSSMGLMGMKTTEINCQKVEESSKNEDMVEVTKLIELIKSDCEVAFKKVNIELEKL